MLYNKGPSNSQPNPDIYKTHFNKGAQAFSLGNYLEAQTHFVDGAEAMERLVLSSPIPEVRNAREEALKALLDIAKACGEAHQNVKEIKPQNASSESSSKPGRSRPDDGPTLKVEQLLFKGSKVRFEDIIGHDDAKEKLHEKMIGPFLNPEYFEAFTLTAGGRILLYGPPGTGKTDLGAAAAAEIDADFYPVKGSQLTSMWHGQGEKNVRELFEGVQRNSKRAIIFLDDVHHLFAKNNGLSSEPHAAMLNEFLTALDGLEHRRSDAGDSKLLVMATTNQPWVISSNILSRLGTQIYIPLPSEDERERILMLKCVDMSLLDSRVNLREVAKRTQNFSGRDLTGLCLDVRTEAAKTSAAKGSLVKITPEMFEKRLGQFHPSSSPKEIQEFENWRNTPKI